MNTNAVSEVLAGVIPSGSNTIEKAAVAVEAGVEVTIEAVTAGAETGAVEAVTGVLQTGAVLEAQSGSATQVIQQVTATEMEAGFLNHVVATVQSAAPEDPGLMEQGKQMLDQAVIFCLNSFQSSLEWFSAASTLERMGALIIGILSLMILVLLVDGLRLRRNKINRALKVAAEITDLLKTYGLKSDGQGIEKALYYGTEELTKSLIAEGGPLQEEFEEAVYDAVEEQITKLPYTPAFSEMVQKALQETGKELSKRELKDGSENHAELKAGVQLLMKNSAAAQCDNPAFKESVTAGIAEKAETLRDQMLKNSNGPVCKLLQVEVAEVGKREAVAVPNTDEFRKTTKKKLSEKGSEVLKGQLGNDRSTVNQTLISGVSEQAVSLVPKALKDCEESNLQIVRNAIPKIQVAFMNSLNDNKLREIGGKPMEQFVTMAVQEALLNPSDEVLKAAVEAIEGRLPDQISSTTYNLMNDPDADLKEMFVQLAKWSILKQAAGLGAKNMPEWNEDQLEQLLRTTSTEMFKNPQTWLRELAESLNNLSVLKSLPSSNGALMELLSNVSDQEELTDMLKSLSAGAKLSLRRTANGIEFYVNSISGDSSMNA